MGLLYTGQKRVRTGVRADRREEKRTWMCAAADEGGPEARSRMLRAGGRTRAFCILIMAGSKGRARRPTGGKGAMDGPLLREVNEFALIVIPIMRRQIFLPVMSVCGFPA
jgi:hypothetical protein